MALAGAFAINGAGPRGAATRSAACPWLDQSLPVARRVRMLLARMSLADKIAEMYVVASSKPVGALGYQGMVPAQRALCIPVLREQDGSLGVYAAEGATQLPSEISLASAWDPELAYRYGVVNGREHRAKGIAMVLGPGINIQRDPRWGRNFEMFSEDPLLTSVLGDADIEGIQSQQVLADAKHFATYNQETNRGTPKDDTIVERRALHEIYLPPFYSAVARAHVASVMCAYPLLNGVYSCGNPGLLSGLLDRRWGFSGFVRSDSAASASTVGSANAGLDQERGSFHWDNGKLAAAVADGRVSLTTINDAVTRILTELFRFELFNDPPTGTIETPASTMSDRALGLEVAERGVVLLQNRGRILPLRSASIRSIAVIGADGTTDPVSSGGGSSHVRAAAVISPLEGIVARAGRRISVRSYSGSDPARAAATASEAQVAVVFASYEEREAHDLESISLPGTQNAVIRAAAEANPDTIVVLNTGGPVLMPWLKRVKGVMEAWYPGQDDGSAIAAVLFGNVDPSGHLPETFPTSLAKIPTASRSQFPGVDGKVDYSEGLDVGYRWYDAKHVTPLFPFGYGLSYTSFSFTHLTVTPAAVVNRTSGPDAPRGQAAAVAKLTAVVTNTGAVTGSEVAQLYVGDPAAAREPPRQLEGFERVTLRPHQSQTVSFTVTGHELSYFDTAANGWTLPAGTFSIYVGGSSALSSLPLRGRLEVTRTIGARYVRLRVPAKVEPGTSFTATARFVNDGNLPITGGTVQLTAPSTWTVAAPGTTTTISLAPGQSATRSFQVTAPESAEGQVQSLTAQLRGAGRDGAGDLSRSVAVSVRRPITVSTRSPEIVMAGGSVSAVISLTSHMAQAVVVDLAPALPAGVTISPASPTVTVPAGSTVKLPVTVSVAARTSARSDWMPLDPSFTYGGTRYPMARAGLTVDVPYATLRAAFDNRGISDDSDVGAASFDGHGASYSEQALAAAGLARGAKVTVGAATLTWPDVPAGKADNVRADGQTILGHDASAATQLTFLGATSTGKEPGITTLDVSGTGTIEYTDGTTQSYRLVFGDWLKPRDLPSNTTVATAAYLNDSRPSSHHRLAGRRYRLARIFAASIRLDPHKTVSSVTLPKVATLPGVHPMHIFAMALGAGRLGSKRR